jgi:hypothetical protein
MFQKESLKRSPANQAPGKFKGPFLDIGSTLKPSTKTAQAMKPCVGAPDDPADFAKTASVRFAASGNRCGNACNVQRAAIFLVVVNGVGKASNRFTQRSTSQTANRRDGVDQRKKSSDIVAVGARQDDRDQRAVGVARNVMLGTGSLTIDGIRATFFAHPSNRSDLNEIFKR